MIQHPYRPPHSHLGYHLYLRAATSYFLGYNLDDTPLIGPSELAPIKLLCRIRVCSFQAHCERH